MSRTTFMAIAVLWSSATHAIVNLDNLHLATPEEGLSGSARLGFSGDAGNSETFTVDGRGRLQWRHAPWTRFLLFNYTYGESRDVANKNKGFIHARHLQQHSPVWAWEGFGQIETNAFARLTYRGLLGGGVRMTLGERSEHHAAYLGLGGFYSHEALEDARGATDSNNETVWRGNIYLVLQRRLYGDTYIASTTYLQPSVTAPADFRLLETAGLTVKLSERLNLILSLDATYDNKPPQTVEKADISYTTAMEFVF